MPCENLETEYCHLLLEMDGLQSQLRDASPPQKPDIVKQITQQRKKIRAKQFQVDSCLATNNINTILVTFTGTSTLTTTYGAAQGPFTNSIVFTLLIGPHRRALNVWTFPAISTTPFDTPLGTNVTTVTKSDGGIGSFDPETGELGIGLSLFFDHSVDTPFYDEDSTLPLLLGTGSVGSLQGSPLDRATGGIVLVGVGTFRGGILGGDKGTLVLSGTMSPSPFP